VTVKKIAAGVARHRSFSAPPAANFDFGFGSLGEGLFNFSVAYLNKKICVPVF
jgi:hypothetical protein